VLEINDLDSDINSERAESSDAFHEVDCIVIPSPEANWQNEWYNNTCEDDNISYSSGILSIEEEVIPSGSNNTNQQINKIISDEVTRQSSDTSTKEIIDNVRHGICIIGMPNGKPCSKVIRTGDLMIALWRHLKSLHGYTESNNPSAIEISTSKPHNIVEQAICDHIVTELIIAQNLPFSLVESKIFKRFAKIMDSRWTVPNKEKVKDLIDDGFKRICAALHNDLQQADTISLTANMWTAYSHDSYLGITVTWIDKKFELNNAVLAFTHLRYPHTADIIVKSIQDILEFWNLRNKVFSITTDSGANIKLACSKLGIKWVPCSAHILNLIVQKGLLPAKYLMTRMNRLIKFFTIPKQGERLEKVQRSHQTSNNQEKLNEILSSSFTVQPEADAIADGKRLKEIMITESEWAEVASIINILKPFDDVTNYISSSSYSTMSIIYPTIIFLRNVLLKLFENDNISDFILYDEETIFDNEDLTDMNEELEELKSLANTINLTNTIKKTMAGLFEKYYK
ncbi:25413_t:CDS:2, partial [Gigaspora margarita]